MRYKHIHESLPFILDTNLLSNTFFLGKTAFLNI